jgi:hypothetical protein
MKAEDVALMDGQLYILLVSIAPQIKRMMEGVAELHTLFYRSCHLEGTTRAFFHSRRVGIYMTGRAISIFQRIRYVSLLLNTDGVAIYR